MPNLVSRNILPASTHTLARIFRPIWRNFSERKYELKKFDFLLSINLVNNNSWLRRNDILLLLPSTSRTQRLSSVFSSPTFLVEQRVLNLEKSSIAIYQRHIGTHIQVLMEPMTQKSGKLRNVILNRQFSGNTFHIYYLYFMPYVSFWSADSWVSNKNSGFIYQIGAHVTNVRNWRKSCKMIKYMPLQGLFELEMFRRMARNPTTKEGCAPKRYKNGSDLWANCVGKISSAILYLFQARSPIVSLQL